MSAEPLLTLSSALSEGGIDPYRFPGSFDVDSYPAVTPLDDDDLLPPPDPKRRLPLPLAAHDKRRLELHVALTTAGVAPLPGDLEAITILCGLDDGTVETVLRWITTARPRSSSAC
ncbi:hypothetical protein [Streptomyces sp. NPDC059176]|uniref:hypothetical protein n=1 Tax=unclassified Streptomyces TaxID=2593676 RepID=UPI003695992E